jgi:hypothetical protein
MIVIIIIGIIGSRALKGGRNAGEQAILRGLVQGCNAFKQDNNNMPPPLVDDDAMNVRGGPIDLLTDPNHPRPRVWPGAFLASEVTPDEQRFSKYSLSYYLIGVLDARTDGVDGPGYTKVEDDGSFSRKGARIEPKYNTGRDPSRVMTETDPAHNPSQRVVLLDRWKNPIRYYRWKPSYIQGGGKAGLINQYHVPRAVGDPNTQPELRNAEFAVVSLGPDGGTDPAKPWPNRASNQDGTVDGTTQAAPEHLDDLVEAG